MHKDELLMLIAQGEGSMLEFKSDEIKPEKLAREIVALANLRGGRILLGVSDDGELTGWQKDKTEEWLMDAVIGENVRPRITPYYEELIINDKRVGVVAVPQGVVKPYAVQKHGSGDKILIRIGSICREASREQIMRMMDSAGGGFCEKQPVHGSDYRRDLNLQLVENYFRDIDKAKYGSAMEMEMLMRNRDFLVGQEFRDELLCSCFAYALFARNPWGLLPQAGIRILAFRGTEMETDALLDEKLDAPFLGYVPTMANLPSIPDLVLTYLGPYISREKIYRNTRRRNWDYPKAVLRELIVNAFAHRDWTMTNQIRIVAFADRLEITSPGALPNGMTIEKIKSGEQTPRNPKIVRILRDYGFVEDRGMGIRRKVIPLMHKHNRCEPIFEATENYFRVILPKRKK